MTRRIVALSAAVLVLCYAPILRGMFEQWSHDEDMGHGFIVPIAIAWIVWKERSRWMALPAHPCWWGLALLAGAGCLHFASIIGAGLFAGSVALVLSVAGAVLCLGGVSFLKAWSFPFLLTLFMLPKLAIVYNEVTLPLQLVASRLAEAMLLVGGASVTRDGNIMDVSGHTIAVAESCSGIRYLLPLGFVAVMFAYLSDAKPWMRVALLAAAIPLAILGNSIRVAVSASVPALDAGAPHALSGWLFFVVCLGILVILRRLFNEVYARYHA